MDAFWCGPVGLGLDLEKTTGCEDGGLFHCTFDFNAENLYRNVDV